jgi:glycosyltransferase involved in cell wall biosynthesis
VNTVSFAIPVYRNQGSLRPTYEKIQDLFKAKLVDSEFEIVFVDDGSDDNSLAELLRLREQDSRVKIVSFSRNFGQVVALTAALECVSGHCAVVMSADLQDPVELVEEMIREWRNGNEIVICHRIGREEGIFRILSSRLFYLVMKLVNDRLPSGGFDFCLLDRVCIDEMNKIRDRNAFFQGDVLSLGFNVKFIPYKRLRRPIGESQWTFAKKVKTFLDCLIATSYMPIRLMSLAGVVTALLGFLYGLAIVYSRLAHRTPFPGWAPIMILILWVGGMLMFMLGVIGEYLWRIYDEVKKRPRYVVKERFL